MKIFPALLAQDAAGPGEGGAKFGGFSLGLAFPDSVTLAGIYARHESVGLSMQQLGNDEL